MNWPRFAPVRYLSYTIDTVLLTAALMLWTILPSGLFANGWLLALLPWVLQIGSIYLSPRADGRPG
jgi:hypothetical protein